MPWSNHVWCLCYGYCHCHPGTMSSLSIQRTAALTTSIIHPSTNSSAGPTYVPKHVCRLRWSDVKGDKGRGHLKARYLVSRPQLWRASLSSPIAYCKDNPSQSSDGARRDIKDSYQVWLNLADAAPRARHVLRPPVGCLVLPSIIKTAYWPRKRVAFSLLFFSISGQRCLCSATEREFHSVSLSVESIVQSLICRRDFLPFLVQQGNSRRKLHERQSTVITPSATGWRDNSVY